MNITGSLLEGFNEPVYRFIPGISRGEGLFLCALRKANVECGMWNEKWSPKAMKNYELGMNSSLETLHRSEARIIHHSTFNTQHSILSSAMLKR